MEPGLWISAQLLMTTVSPAGAVPHWSGLLVRPDGCGDQEETNHGQDQPEDAQGHQGKSIYNH